MNNVILSFPDLLKAIRKETGLSQEKFAEKLWVSTMLIAMVETWQREPSKKIINILSDKLWVNSFSLMPFLSIEEVKDFDNLSFIEKKLYELWSWLQKELIEKKSKLLIS